MGNEARRQDRALQVLFALARAWSFLSFGIFPLGEGAARWIPFPEGSRLHAFADEAGPPIVAIAMAAGFVGVVLLVLLIAGGLALDPPGPNPEDPQHIPALFWLAPWAMAALTPIGGILVAWTSTRRQPRE